MNTKTCYPLEFFLLFIETALILLAAAWLFGFRVNVTPSAPVGIYYLSSESAERGDLVAFCLNADSPYVALADERGYLGPGSCPSGLRPLLKRLAGLPGDTLQIRSEGLILNDVLLPGTVRPDHDRLGRGLPESSLREGTIPDGFGLVLAQEHPGSFDSRHFGLIPLADLRRVKLIFPFNTKENGVSHEH